MHVLVVHVLVVHVLVVHVLVVHCSGTEVSVVPPTGFEPVLPP